MYSRLRVFPSVLRRFSTRLPIPVDAEGNTPLHHAIKQCDSVFAFDQLLNHFGRPAMVQMSKTMNNVGELPIDWAEADAFSFSGYSVKLFELMSPTDLQPLHASLSVDALLAAHGDEGNPVLNRHLRVACALVNDVREKINISTSHPSFDPYLPASDAVIKQFAAIRQKCRLSCELTSVHLPNAYVLKKAKMTLRYGMGNCEEYSCLAMNLLETQPFYGVSAEMVAMEPGDHVFVVLGRAPAAAAKDLRSWGRAAVICDPWMGAVYPVSTFEIHGRDYRYYDDPVRQQAWPILPYFNKHYQQLMVVSDRVKGGSVRERHGFFKLPTASSVQAFVAQAFKHQP